LFFFTKNILCHKIKIEITKGETMNKKISNFIYSLLVGIVAMFPLKAAAAPLPPEIPIVNPSGNVTAQDVAKMIANIINWILVVAGALAAIMLIYGGIKYIFSSGDEKRTESAKKTILYAVIGVIVITASYFIVSFSANLLTSVSSTP